MPPGAFFYVWFQMIDGAVELRMAMNVSSSDEPVYKCISVTADRTPEVVFEVTEKMAASPNR